MNSNLQGKVLIVDDEEDLCRIIAAKLRKAGFQTDAAHTGQAALERLEKEPVDVVILDYMLPDVTGLDILQKIRIEFPPVKVIMLTAYGNVEHAVKAMRLGAFDYLNKPTELEVIRELIMKACEASRLQKENEQLREQLETQEADEELVYQSERMREIFRMLERIKNTAAPVLILGESGTGKTALAKWLHRHGDRGKRPFVSLNCAAIPESLLESELFGYRKGAFTGATESRAGKFEAADGGTIFLDEIGEMPLTMQAKLLSVIEEKSFMKLGSTAYIHVDVRIITATNRNIRRLVQEGKFRQDLYYRLNLVEIELPPLRERKEDIPLIAKRYMAILNRKYNKEVLLTDEVIDELCRPDWPGNVRELLNVLERIHIIHPDGLVGRGALTDFPLLAASGDFGTHKLGEPGLIASDENPERNATAPLMPPPIPEVKEPLPKMLNDVEEEIIRRALEQTDGNRTRAAEMLGISRHTLLYKLKKLNID